MAKLRNRNQATGAPSPSFDTQRPRAFDDTPAQDSDRAPSEAEHPFDTEPMRRFAKQLEDWWTEARDMHAESRMQRYLDHDYYDHEQISPEDRAVYESRKQAPVVLNLVHGAIDWLSGTERRTRVDWKIRPRGPEDEVGAEAQTHLLKYVSDANRAAWERSRAFKDAAISGVGFTEEFLRRDRNQVPVGHAYCDWRYLWWDPYSRDLDLGDARYFHRAKIVDLDHAIAMNPGRGGDLRAISVSTMDNEYELLDESDGLPGMLVLSGNSHYTRGGIGGLRERFSRRRVRLIETWYPKAMASKQVQAEIADCCDLEGLTYDPTNAELREKLAEGQISLVDAVTTRMSLAIWAPGVGILSMKERPYRHNKFPFTPTWCYRHHRDGMPYGFVRGMRDAQDEYNKRRAKALFAVSVNRVLYEKDAFEQDDEDHALEQISMPNGEVPLAAGGLQKIKIETGVEVGKAHVEFQREAKEHIYEGNGITRENLGQQTNAISGRAIMAKQQQGAVTTVEVFDLYRLSHEISGQKLLELTKQGMAGPRKIQILGGNKGAEWIGINQPYIDPMTGEVRWENDILNTLSDFKVDAQDYRETVRLAMAESLFETIGKMPPEVALQLIDLAVELTDLPNKDEFIARIRKLNGTTPTPQTPEQQMAQAEQQAAAERAVAMDEARIEGERAKAEKLRAEARAKVIEGKGQALNTTHLVAAALPMAQAADDLYAGASATPPQPVPAGVTTQ